ARLSEQSESCGQPEKEEQWPPRPGDDPLSKFYGAGERGTLGAACRLKELTLPHWFFEGPAVGGEGGGDPKPSEQYQRSDQERGELRQIVARAFHREQEETEDAGFCERFVFEGVVLDRSFGEALVKSEPGQVRAAAAIV